MVASKEPTLVGGWAPLIRQLQVKVTPRAWWMSKVLLVWSVTVTPSKSTFETGASGTAQKIPGPLSPDAVEAVMF